MGGEASGAECAQSKRRAACLDSPLSSERQRGAVDQAAEILSSYFTQVYDPAPEEIAEVMEVKDKSSDGFVEDLDLPTRTTNALKKGGYERLQDLTVASISDLNQVKNLGDKSVEEIVIKLKSKNIILK